jgi:hypothetical protein
MGEDKVRENRVRRLAERQGYLLEKSRSRDPRAPDYGRYALVKPPVSGPTFNRDQIGQPLEEIEAWLLRPPEPGAIKNRLVEIRDQMAERVRELITERKLVGVTEEGVDGDSGRTFRLGKARSSVAITNGVLNIIVSVPMPLAVLGGDPVDTGARAMVEWLVDPFAQL